LSNVFSNKPHQEDAEIVYIAFGGYMDEGNHAVVG